MKKILYGVAVALLMTVATPVLAVEEETTTTTPAIVYGASPAFLWPKVQEYVANYWHPITKENTVGFLGNKNAKGTLFLGTKTVQFPRNNYGVSIIKNALAGYPISFKDNGATYHSFILPKTLRKGHYFARGCFESNYGLSCGLEFKIIVR